MGRAKQILADELEYTYYQQYREAIALEHKSTPVNRFYHPAPPVQTPIDRFMQKANEVAQKHIELASAWNELPHADRNAILSTMEARKIDFLQPSREFYRNVVSFNAQRK